jgi:hypothetical protein
MRIDAAIDLSWGSVFPKIAINWWAVAPFSAAILAPAFRSPCAEHCLSHFKLAL